MVDDPPEKVPPTSQRQFLPAATSAESLAKKTGGSRRPVFH
jgi:hypothetical protein